MLTENDLITEGEQRARASLKKYVKDAVENFRLDKLSKKQLKTFKREVFRRTGYQLAQRTINKAIREQSMANVDFTVDEHNCFAARILKNVEIQYGKKYKFSPHRTTDKFVGLGKPNTEDTKRYCPYFGKDQIEMINIINESPQLREPFIVKDFIIPDYLDEKTVFCTEDCYKNLIVDVQKLFESRNYNSITPNSKHFQKRVKGGRVRKEKYFQILTERLKDTFFKVVENLGVPYYKFIDDYPFYVKDEMDYMISYFWRNNIKNPAGKEYPLRKYKNNFPDHIVTSSSEVGSEFKNEGDLHKSIIKYLNGRSSPSWFFRYRPKLTKIRHEVPLNVTNIPSQNFSCDLALEYPDALIPIEVKRRKDRGIYFQIVKYIHGFKMKGLHVPEAWLIIPEITPDILLFFHEHNLYNPVKLKLFVWKFIDGKFEMYEYKSIYKMMKKLFTVEAQNSV